MTRVKIYDFFKKGTKLLTKELSFKPKGVRYQFLIITLNNNGVGIHEGERLGKKKNNYLLYRGERDKSFCYNSFFKTNYHF